MSYPTTSPPSVCIYDSPERFTQKKNLTGIEERQKIVQNVSINLIEQHNNVFVGGVAAAVALDRE
jgi:hypothetical protein